MYSSEPEKGQKRRQTAKVFKEFCESTSLHGYPYLFIANSIILKILWSIVIIAFTCIGIGFVISNTNDYLSSNIITTIDTSSEPLTVSVLNHDEKQMVEPANYQDYGNVELFTDWLNRGLKEFNK